MSRRGRVSGLGLAARWLVGASLAVGVLTFPVRSDLGVRASGVVDAGAVAGLVGQAKPVEPTRVPPLSSPRPVDVLPTVPDGLFEDEVSDSVRVEELVSERTASSDSWVNSDGSLSVTSYALQRYFQAEGRAEWLPIDSTLVASLDGVGRVESKANSWSVSFGASTAPEGMQVFDLEGGLISFTPVDANESKPLTGDTLVTYAELWPGVDAVYSVSSVGVDERLVLKSPSVASSFVFEVVGASPRLNVDGGVDLLRAGVVVAMIPPLTVDTATQSIPPEKVGARFEVTALKSVDGGRVEIGLNRDWLSGLAADEFPVVIDPTLFPTLAPTATASYSSSNTSIGSLRVGQSAAGTRWRAKAYIPYPPLPGGGQPWRLVRAQMFGTVSGGLGAVSLLGEPLEPMSFNGILDQGQLLSTVSTGPANFSAMVTDWVAQRPGLGAWYGLTGNESPGFTSIVDISSLSVEYRYYQSPNPTSLQSPTGTIATTTPLLQAVPVTGETQPVGYKFQVGTEPGAAGNVVDSGWITSSSWQVPAGSLTDGATYYVKIWVGIGNYYAPGYPDYVPPAAPTTIVPITIKKRLGAGGPSPTDTVGSVPGSTDTPSEAAPSPGVSPASATVNMVTGNLAVSLNTHPLSTLSGPAGVTLSYDSIGSTGSEAGGRGLSGRYFTGSTLIGQRTDPTIDFTWPGSPMGGYLDPSSTVTADWSGSVRVPAAVGSWRLGGTVASGTMRIFLDGSTTPYATVTASGTPSFGVNLPWTANSLHTVKIEYTSTNQRGLQLWASDSGVPTNQAGSGFVVPSGWLTPNSTGLPVGWRLSTNPYAGAWTRLDDLGAQVVLRSASGDTATFVRRLDGSYIPPAGSSDLLTVAKTSVAGLMTAGEFTLSNETGVEIVFGRDGWVRSARTLADDRRPTALQYNYEVVPGSGSTPVLTGITDPVTNRGIGLCYGAATCDVGDDYDTSNAPAGLLAQISYWDSTFATASRSTLVYDSYGRFVRLMNPGGLVADFAYDASGRVIEIRDPLATDAIAAGKRSDCPATFGASTPTCTTQIAYNSTTGKVGTVTQPAPTPGAARTTRTYTYNPSGVANTAQVSVSGFNPVSGYASRVKWDDKSRIIEQRDPEQRLTRTIWDPNIDRVLSTINPLNLQSTNLYDNFTNLLTDTYGPAPSTCFATSAPYAPAGACAVTVPRTQHRYDEGINGLAATFWDNPYFAGAPKKHGTGPGGTGPSGVPGCTPDTLCTQWNTLPVTPLGITRGSEYEPGHQFTWSMRLSGIIDTAQIPKIITGTTQDVTIYIDGVLYTNVNPHIANGETDAPFGEWGLGPPYNPTIPAGKHRIRIDYLGANPSTLNGLFLIGSNFVSNSVLSPDYGLETTTIDADNKTVTTSYTDAANGIGPELGLVTATTQDPAGLALTSTTTYESPPSDRWLRTTASTLPSGTATTYKHYCSKASGAADCGADQYQDAIADACGVSTFDSQWGLVAEQTDPAANPTTAARSQQFLYDRVGRVVGRRVGPANTIGSAEWECTTYDYRGRIATQTWPAFGTAAARTVTRTYGVGGNPLTNSVSDPAGTITATTDLLGRLTAYTDVHGRTTTYGYDQAGRLTTISNALNASVVTNTYTTNSSKLATTQIAVSGQVQATAAVTYDTYGRTSYISYNGGQMVGSASYDTSGNQSWMSFEKNTSPEPTRITGNAVTRSPAGRQTNAWVDTGSFDLVDPNPAGDNFIYDGAGRLTTAHLPGGVATYSYNPNPPADNCTTHATGINPQAGRNTNRTATTFTPTTGTATTTRSCYNTADQVVATIVGSTPTTTYTYDTRGNQTLDGNDTYTWDSANRLRTIATTGTTITYTRDALDRLTQRTQNSTTTRHTYNGYSDSPAGVLNASNTLIEQFHTLPGGVLVTINQTGLTKTWSYPDLKGNYSVTTDNTGTPTTTTRIQYGPWGERLASSTSNIDNATGNLDAGAFGQHGKLEEDTTQRTIIMMGARPYSPRDGRFLAIDPIKGGCANDYVYVAGDPLNRTDLSGKALSGCNGTHIVENGSISIRLGSTASGALQIGLSFSARPNQGDLAQLIFFGSTVSVRAPSLGLNFDDIGGTMVPGSIIRIPVPAGRPSSQRSGIRLDIQIQTHFWGVSYRDDWSDLLNTEVAGNLVISVSCSL